MNDPIVMEFAVNSVTVSGKTYALEATVSSAAVDRVRNQPKNKDVQKVVGGAAIGAIAGQILGKNTKSTVIGAAAGAAAGAATAAATANYEGCVRPGGSIVVTLSAPVSVTS
jgi:outer membrane lipoprotein SlyB